MSDVTDSQLVAKGNSIVTSLHNIRQALFDKGVLTDQEAFGLRNVTLNPKSIDASTSTFLSKVTYESGDLISPSPTYSGLSNAVLDAITVTATEYYDSRNLDPRDAGYMTDYMGYSFATSVATLRHKIEEALYGAYSYSSPNRSLFGTTQLINQRTGNALQDSELPSYTLVGFHYRGTNKSQDYTRYKYYYRFDGTLQGVHGTARWNVSPTMYKDTVPVYSEFDPQIRIGVVPDYIVGYTPDSMSDGIYYLERWIKAVVAVGFRTMRRSRVGIVPLDQLAGKIRAAIPDPAT